MANNFTVNNVANNDFTIGLAPAAAPVKAKPAAAPEAPKQPSIYGPVPQIPTMDAVEGIKFDFNEGISFLTTLINFAFYLLRKIV